MGVGARNGAHFQLVNLRGEWRSDLSQQNTSCGRAHPRNRRVKYTTRSTGGGLTKKEPQHENENQKD
jgi:hypothetical protein